VELPTSGETSDLQAGMSECSTQDNRVEKEQEQVRLYTWYIFFPVHERSSLQPISYRSDDRQVIARSLVAEAGTLSPGCLNLRLPRVRFCDVRLSLWPVPKTPFCRYVYLLHICANGFPRPTNSAQLEPVTAADSLILPCRTRSRAWLHLSQEIPKSAAAAFAPAISEPPFSI
jgi:hypothetical protein